jgi:hypothetical protein
MESSFARIHHRALSTRKQARGRPALPTTKKDRLRTLEAPPKPTAEEFLDRAESNLTSLQNSLYSFWRGKGNARPARKGLNMDHRWWFWSTNMALLPAYCIFIYCEFFGQHEMKKFHAENLEMQRRKALGLDFDDEEEKELFSALGPIGGLVKIADTAEQSRCETTANDTPEALAERVQALEAQLQLLRAAERRRMQRSYQSGIQNRNQDQLLENMRDKDSTVEVPEELGFMDKAFIRLAENAQGVADYVTEQTSLLVKIVLEELSSQEEKQKKRKDLPPPPPETMIDTVDDTVKFKATDTFHAALSSNDSTADPQLSMKAAEQAAGVQEHPTDLWTKTWAVITGSNSGPKKDS